MNPTPILATNPVNPAPAPPTVNPVEVANPAPPTVNPEELANPAPPAVNPEELANPAPPAVNPEEHANPAPPTVNPEEPAEAALDAPPEEEPAEAALDAPPEEEPVKAALDAPPEEEPAEAALDAPPEEEPAEAEENPEDEPEEDEEEPAEAEEEPEPTPNPLPKPSPPSPPSQMGGAVDSKLEMRIRAELLEYNEDDNVNTETIVKNVVKYIKNYKSSEYKQYLNALENLYSKLGKRAKLYNTDDAVYLINANASDISKKSNIIDSIIKPKIADIDKVLEDAKSKNDLESYETYRIYKHLVNNTNLENEYDDDDEKQAELFLNKIERSSTENDVMIVTSSKYTVPQSLIDDMNSTNMQKLEEYNNIIEQIRNMKSKSLDKDLKQVIKSYFEHQKVSTKEFKNKKHINFVILKLPSQL